MPALPITHRLRFGNGVHDGREFVGLGRPSRRDARLVRQADSTQSAAVGAKCWSIVWPSWGLPCVPPDFGRPFL